MFGEGLIEVFGAGAALIAVLGAFWKGDDAISQDLREDIAIRLLLLEPQRQAFPDVRRFVLAWLNFVFGSSHLSVKCGFMSTFVSVFLFSVTYYFIAGFSFVALLFDAPDLFLFLLIALCFVNVVADYLSLWKSRQLLSSDWPPAVLLVMDVVLTAVISGSILMIALTQLGNFMGPGIVNFNGGFVPEIRLLFSTIPSEDVGRYMMSAFLTTFVTVGWSLLALAGYYGLRWSARLLPVLKYALPIQSRPVRSIGVFLTGGALVLLLIARAVQAVG